jgi:hypothetical protein
MIETVTIPTPRVQETSYRGFHDTFSQSTTPVSIRWTDKDREFIELQAHRLGLTFSEFVRWCTYHTAKEVSRAGREADFRAAQERSKVNTDEYTEDTQ